MADQLTLFQPVGADQAHYITTAPSDFRMVRRLWRLCSSAPLSHCLLDTCAPLHFVQWCAKIHDFLLTPRQVVMIWMANLAHHCTHLRYPPCANAYARMGKCQNSKVVSVLQFLDERGYQMNWVMPSSLETVLCYQNCSDLLWEKLF